MDAKAGMTKSSLPTFHRFSSPVLPLQVTKAGIFVDFELNSDLGVGRSTPPGTGPMHLILVSFSDLVSFPNKQPHLNCIYTGVS